MKKIIVLSLLLTGCVTSDPNPLATNLQQAQAKSDIMVCEAQLRGGQFESEEISRRKLNCQRVFDDALKLQLATAASSNVCSLHIEAPNKFTKAEIKKRGIDCDKVMAVYYQEQQIIAQQEAAAAQHRAASAAMMNAFNANRPRTTKCYGYGYGASCTTY